VTEGGGGMKGSEENQRGKGNPSGRIRSKKGYKENSFLVDTITKGGNEVKPMGGESWIQKKKEKQKTRYVAQEISQEKGRPKIPD